MKLKSNRKLILVIISVIFTSFLLVPAINEVYAEDEPDITLYIHGQKSAGGPIINEKGDMAYGLWAPGKTEKGTLRLYNSYSQRIRVTNLGLMLRLEKLEGEQYKTIEDKQLIELFAKNMKLIIKKGTMLIFSNTIYDKSFYEMLYEKGSEQYKGYDLPIFDRFNIGKNNYIDLEYTVHMDEVAGNELQGLKANVDFLINVQENPTYNPSKTRDSEGEGVTINFIDIDKHWAHDCIITLFNHGIIQGYPDNTIRPDNYITRGEAAVLVGRALELEEKERLLHGYIDSIPKWARGYILAASENGIFKGYPGRLFRSNNYITREEMVAVLMRGFELKAQDNLSLTFDDRDKVQKWALEYIKKGIHNNIIQGYPDNTFKPQNNVTRAEAFTMICKLLGYHKEHSN